MGSGAAARKAAAAIRRLGRLLHPARPLIPPATPFHRPARPLLPSASLPHRPARPLLLSARPLYPSPPPSGRATFFVYTRVLVVVSPPRPHAGLRPETSFLRPATSFLRPDRPLLRPAPARRQVRPDASVSEQAPTGSEDSKSDLAKICELLKSIETDTKENAAQNAKNSEAIQKILAKQAEPKRDWGSLTFRGRQLNVPGYLSLAISVISKILDAMKGA